MGLSKQWLIGEQQRKKDFYDNELPRITFAQEEELESLRNKIVIMNSWKSKIVDYIVSGAIGVIIGWSLNYIIN